MKSHRCLSWVAVGLALLAIRTDAEQVRVVANRVNLRAGPSANAEVVTQTDKGVVLFAGVTNGEWLAVTPPSSVDLCIHSELVKDGVVSASKAMVRGGPGINYRAVGTLRKGDAVNVRNTAGDWLKIEPPAGCVLWISRQYVEPLEGVVEAARPAAQPPPGSATPPPAPLPSPLEATPVPKPPLPEIGPALKPAQATAPVVSPVETRAPPQERAPWTSWLDPKSLAPSKAQGQEVTVSGVLRRALLVWRRPSRYCIVNYNANGVAIMSCYIAANQSQLEGLKGRHMTVYGREYWVQGVRHPVIVPERIVRQD